MEHKVITVTWWRFKVARVIPRKQSQSDMFDMENKVSALMDFLIKSM